MSRWKKNEDISGILTMCI